MIRVFTLLLVFILAAAGCGSGEQADEGTTTVVADGPATGAKRGDTAPDFDLERLDGGRLRLSELRGKAVVIDFWDTWCPPCRMAMPHLQELSVEYEDDLVVVGVAIGRNGKAAVAKFVQENGLTFPMVLIDEKFETARAFGGVQSLPTTFLIDAEGVVREVWTGYNAKAVYKTAISKVVGA